MVIFAEIKQNRISDSECARTTEFSLNNSEHLRLYTSYVDQKILDPTVFESLLILWFHVQNHKYDHNTKTVGFGLFCSTELVYKLGCFEQCSENPMSLGPSEAEMVVLWSYLWFCTCQKRWNHKINNNSKTVGSRILGST